MSPGNASPHHPRAPEGRQQTLSVEADTFTNRWPLSPLGGRVDYAQVVKEFASAGGEEARRYAPPRLIGQEKVTVSGTPDEDRVSTSHVERANWTLRGHLRRFTRLSNGFSRKKANLRAALALYFAYYNFCRMHKSIRMTPAMAAGIARKPWSLAELMYAAQGAAAAGQA